MKNNKAILFALLAAAFYAINVPFSKLLLEHVGAKTMAALLYLGAGIGIGAISLLDRNDNAEKLDRKDTPYVLGMILLDIAAVGCKHLIGNCHKRDVTYPDGADINLLALSKAGTIYNRLSVETTGKTVLLGFSEQCFVQQLHILHLT